MERNATANRAFARLKADGAQEFTSLGDLAGRLRDLGKVQEDRKGTLLDFAPEVAVEEDGGWGLVASHAGRRLPFREHAFDQFAAMIGFPARTLTRCPAPLAAENVAYFSFMEGGRDVLARAEQGEVRSWHGGDYEPVNHLEVAETLLGSALPFKIHWSGMSAKQLFVLAVEEDRKWDGPDGSKLQHATLVGNSETGEGSFYAQDLLFEFV